MRATGRAKRGSLRIHQPVPTVCARRTAGKRKSGQTAKRKRPRPSPSGWSQWTTASRPIPRSSSFARSRPSPSPHSSHETSLRYPFCFPPPADDVAEALLALRTLPAGEDDGEQGNADGGQEISLGGEIDEKIHRTAICHPCQPVCDSALPALELPTTV